MKRMKHNKKRNTLFLFEILVREMTQCITAGNEDRKSIVLNILKEYFSNNTLLRKEKVLLESVLTLNLNLSPRNVEKLLYKTKQEYTKLNSDLIFENQTKLLKKINKELGGEIFKNFIPNYKSIATIHQFFNDQLTPAQQVVVEQQMINFLSSKNIMKEQNEIVHIDKLVYNKFVQNFNNKYSNKLHEEQATLLSHYITSFSDNGLQMKLFVNEEISRLVGGINKFLNKDDSQEFQKGLSDIVNKLKNFNQGPINENSLKEIINIQQLLRELNSNGD